MDAVSEANRYFAARNRGPLKENPERMGTVLYVTAELVRQAADFASAGYSGRRISIARFTGN